LLPQFLITVVYSTYSGLLFADLCQPDDDDDDDERWNGWNKIRCIPTSCTEENNRTWEESKTKWCNDHLDTSELTMAKYTVARVAWFLTVIIIAFKCVMLLATLLSQKFRFFLQWSNYPDLLVIILILFTIHSGEPDTDGRTKLQRWQYHLASFANFFMWIEVMVRMGKFPGNGKYIQMFWDVAKNMLKFLSCYIWLMLGFMMAFVIFFNTERNLQSFPDPLITLLVWMLGELEYKDGFYPEDEEINLERDENGTLTGKGTIDGVATHLQFPGTAHLFIAAYVLFFSITAMNLLVGLAVSDIDRLLKGAKMETLKSQINLIYDVLNFRCTPVYQYLVPQNMKVKFERWFQVNADHEIKKVSYADINDKKYKRSLKNAIFEHHLEKERREVKLRKRQELSEIRKYLEKINLKLSLE